MRDAYISNSLQPLLRHPDVSLAHERDAECIDTVIDWKCLLAEEAADLCDWWWSRAWSYIFDVGVTAGRDPQCVFVLDNEQFIDDVTKFGRQSEEARCLLGWRVALGSLRGRLFFSGESTLETWPSDSSGEDRHVEMFEQTNTERAEMDAPY